MPTRRLPRGPRGAAAVAHVLAPVLLLATGACLHAAAQPLASPDFIAAQRAEAHGRYARAEVIRMIRWSRVRS